MRREYSWKWVVLTTAIVAWLFVVLSAYYVVHKPFTFTIAKALFDRLADLGLCAALLLLAASIGSLFPRRVGSVSSTEGLILGTGLGLGLISIVTFGLVLLGFRQPWLFYPLLLLTFIALLPQVRLVIASLHSTLRPRLALSLPTILGGYLIGIFFIALLLTLTPPIAWDSQVYHLTGPKLLMERGELVGRVDIPYLGFPSLVESLFLLALILKGDILAKLMHLSYALLTLSAVYLFTKRYLGSRVAWIAAALLSSAPSLMLISTWAYVDWAAAFYTLAALFSLATWGERRERSWLMICGVFSGLALGVKYTLLFLPLALCLLVLWEERKHGLEVAIRETIILGITTLLVASPWYLRNLAFTGNPLYPFFLGGPFWDTFRGWWFSRWGSGLAHSPLRLLLAPWEATIYGVEGKLVYEATIGPLFLALLPLLLLPKSGREVRAERAITYSLVTCSVGYIFWLLGVAQSALLRQTRLLFPLFPLLALLSSVAVERLIALTRKGFSPRRLFMMAIGLVLFLSFSRTVIGLAADNPLAYLLGEETREEYLAHRLGSYHQALSFINHRLPSSVKVYFLWEPRSYYCQRECRPDAILDNFKHLTDEYPTAKGVAEALRSQGITHLLLNRVGLEKILEAGFDPIEAKDLELLKELQEGYMELLLVTEDLSYEIYGLK